MQKIKSLLALALFTALSAGVNPALAYDPFADKPVEPNNLASGDSPAFSPPVAGERLKIVTFSSGMIADLDKQFNDWTKQNPGAKVLKTQYNAVGGGFGIAAWALFTLNVVYFEK